jgi:hypothetical protein
MPPASPAGPRCVGPHSAGTCARISGPPWAFWCRACSRARRRGHFSYQGCYRSRLVA